MAPIAPSSARNPKDAAETTGTTVFQGASATMSIGKAAPAAKVARVVQAYASKGAEAYLSVIEDLAVVTSDIPNSSRA